MPLQGQWLVVAALAGCGAALGAGYDLYNTILQGRRGWRWLIPLADVAFWAAALAGVFWVLLVTSDGEMRLSFFAVMGLGFGLYRVWFHPTVVRSVEGIVRVLTYCARVGYRLWMIAVWQPVLGIFRLVIRTLEGILHILSLFENIMLWPLGFVAARVQKRLKTKDPTKSAERSRGIRGLWSWIGRWIKRSVKKG